MPTPSASVILPVGQAFDRVKRILFQPFDLGKWFVIGFCAWLAILGEGGGSVGGGANHRFRGPGGGGGDFRHEFDRARDFVLDNLHWIVPVVVALVVLGLTLWVLFTWLSSRGKFMFLHCVALNRAEVMVPWNEFAREANSLFWFRIALALAGMVLMLPPLVLAFVTGIRMGLQNAWTIADVLGLIGLVLLTIVLGLVLAIIAKLTTDFVVPIMFLHGKRCLEGWSELRRLLAANVGEFLLYLLFQIVLAVAVGLLTLAIVLVTCCVAGCLLAIPYLGTVLYLPVLVFKRAYSLHYLAQYGPAYDVFQPVAPPTAGTGSPLT
jgi:hypothetical protein